MADFVLKQNDRLPSIQATLTYGNATGEQLEALYTALANPASRVDFIMRKAGTAAPKINAQAVVVSAATGVVRYDWIVGDTNTADSYQAEWEVTFPDGKTQTFPTTTYHTIDILPDLDTVGA